MDYGYWRVLVCLRYSSVFSDFIRCFWFFGVLCCGRTVLILADK